MRLLAGAPSADTESCASYGSSGDKPRSVRTTRKGPEDSLSRPTQKPSAVKMSRMGIYELRAGLRRVMRRRALTAPVEGERKLDRLIREGGVTPAPRPWRGKLPKPIDPAGPLSDLVLEDRG